MTAVIVHPKGKNLLQRAEGPYMKDSMEPIRNSDITSRLEHDIPWWKSRETKIPATDFARRVYFAPFKLLALDFNVRRATI